MEKFVYVRPDEVFHTYLNCKFPGKQSHNRLHIHADNDIHPNSSDKLPARSL